MGVVSAVKPRPVTEDNVEGSFPSLWLQMELCHCEWVRYGYVGSAVHHAWLVNLCAHSRSDGCCELGGGPFLLVRFEQSRDESLLSLCHERFLADDAALLASASSKSGSSSFPSWVPFFMQADVLRLSGVHPANFVVGIVRLAGRGYLAEVLRERAWVPCLVLLVPDR